MKEEMHMKEFTVVGRNQSFFTARALENKRVSNEFN